METQSDSDFVPLFQELDPLSEHFVCPHLYEPARAHDPGVGPQGHVVEQDAKDHGCRAQAGEEGHLVTEQQDRGPYQQGTLACVRNTEKSKLKHVLVQSIGSKLFLFDQDSLY